MAALRLTLEKDRDLLAFIFARFIDGEFTGLKEGYALNRAPTLEAADFLAKQIRDEIRHAQMYRTLYEQAAATDRVPPSPWLLTLIMAPVTGRLWLEHCFLDKALGERWVLYLMEVLIAHVDDRKITNHLKAIARDERTHIAFGEAETRTGVGNSRFRKFYLWGLYLRVDFALALAYRLTRSLIRRRYSPEAAALLTDFFSSVRPRIRGEIASLIGVRPGSSFLQMLACQIIFLLRLPFVGWLRNPRQTF
jgi:hypothetical protein